MHKIKTLARIRLWLGLAVLACGALWVPGTWAAASPPLSGRAAPIAFGTLQTDGKHAAEEYGGGLRLAMMEIFWDRYELRPGEFSADYAAAQQRTLKRFKDLGFQVTLALGIHYPPRWLKQEPNAKFVNQHGDHSRDLNFVFNQQMRQHAERYLARIQADLGFDNFWAVRLTSGGNGEVLYPEGGSYWAFDVNAQNGPALPPTLPRCPYPGWKPGQPGLAAAQVRQWADWYVRCLALSVAWQQSVLDKLGFTGWYQILTPGSGVRPSAYDDVIRKNLPDGLLGVGAAWQKLYEFLPDKRRAVVYISSVADRSGHDDLPQPEDVQVPLSDPSANKWSATRWQVRLARAYGLPVGGENPGYNQPASLNPHYVDLSPAGMLARSLAQARAGHFQCFYWAHSAQLWDGTMPFSNYVTAITTAPTQSYPKAR
ncbi:MAG: hypothetical protein WCO56_28465 [Verrucomicrobiota bacterium]